ncbi:MAG: ABC transporter ATP-binding protein [Candidatus Asgardarchaeum californiense]|nr:MAG: ABC transporter ATP-binding protein [Candidatus Asgardarchaeum californiense]
MPDIIFRNVTLRYGDFEAVKKLNFHIYDGEYIGLLGPSGCGKTTTLKLIAGLRTPSEGDIIIDKRIVNGIPPEERNIGMVFQHFAIFPFMTVWENVTYGPKVKGWSDIKAEKAAWDAIELVRLSDKVDVYPKYLSAPELQRVGLARAIASGAKILLLDEPLSMLDVKVRQVFRHEIRRLVKKLGLTAVHVTHDQEEATAVCDRIIVMRKGEIVQIGKPYELYRKPKTLFVANFIGESVFLIGHILEVTDHDSIIRLRGGYLLEAPTTMFNKGSRVVVAIRKEEFKILPASEFDKSTNQLNGTIVQNRFIGFFSRVRIKLKSEEVIEIKVSPEIARTLRVGDEVTLSVNKEDVLVYTFPKEGLEEALSVV